MPESFNIRSYKGEYTVRFEPALEALPAALATNDAHFLVDAAVARLYAPLLEPVLASPRVIVIEANEDNKSLERITGVMHRLVSQQLRRNQQLVAIGGGIIQDITCFIASTILRGVAWKFVPTTLLAQADSCIGSKSSVNLGSVKNILGTFNPPREIIICTRFLDTLAERDVCSGVGEIIKVHAIDSVTAFDRVAADYEALMSDRSVLLHYIERALLIKKRYIEIDEFDQNVRNVFNYGHSFGHAIESATEFAVPHGIAVTLGMEVANSVAAQRGLVSEDHHARMRPLLMENARDFRNTSIPFESMLSALTKDKKNTASQLVLILPVGGQAAVERVPVSNDAAFHQQLRRALEGLRP